MAVLFQSVTEYHLCWVTAGCSNARENDLGLPCSSGGVVQDGGGSRLVSLMGALRALMRVCSMPLSSFWCPLAIFGISLHVDVPPQGHTGQSCTL